jgi:hypothetical protein
MPQAASPVDHAQAGDNGHKNGFDALLESAQAMQTTLRDLLAHTGRIIAGMKAHHRSNKALRDTLAGLRQLGQIEV